MREIINKWLLNKELLASKMEMNVVLFEAKLNTKFTDLELIRLKGILIELRNDLDNVTDIDFNDALKSILG